MITARPESTKSCLSHQRDSLMFSRDDLSFAPYPSLMVHMHTNKCKGNDLCWSSEDPTDGAVMMMKSEAKRRRHQLLRDLDAILVPLVVHVINDPSHLQHNNEWSISNIPKFHSMYLKTLSIA